jgi:DNA-binding CsgD family transcriptional regulator
MPAPPGEPDEGTAGSAGHLPPEMLAGIVDTAPVGIAVVRDDGRCAYVNGCGQQLLGAATRGEMHLDSAAAGQPRAAQAALGALTPREREVLGLLAEGCSNQELARRLEITERTARTHVSNLLGKLRLASRTQAALLAYQEGFPVPPAIVAADGEPGS